MARLAADLKPTRPFFTCLVLQVLLTSHLGRPKKGPEDKFRLNPVQVRLSCVVPVPVCRCACPGMPRLDPARLERRSDAPGFVHSSLQAGWLASSWRMHLTDLCPQSALSLISAAPPV